ncbi:unnamed protein product [Caenorhabditis bovis]|uniref:G-protein coupled receptors family 1 profile domain-containing protein n=1 Tax=Caenorhabditis bovis TaxID=2654633 RepID=A0A8S1EBB3_9PELO|nr:unnamed protein product [Caenorhabditis bovis]
MTTEDRFFVIILTILVVLGFILNLLLLYLILYKSPPTLSPYRIFLANTTITQLLFAFGALISQPRILTSHEYTVVIYLGPIQFYGEWLSYMSYIFILHLSLNSFISLMLSMVYRFNSVKLRRLGVKPSLIICIIGYIYCFILMVSCTQIEVSRDETINEPIVGNIVPDYRQYNMVLSTDIHQLPLMVLITMVTIGLLPIYFVMCWCRFKIYQILKKATTIHNSTTRNNVKRLVNALTIQSIIPVISVFPASLLYVLSQMNTIQSGLYGYFIVPSLTISTIVDPLVTIISVIPYRRCVLQLCHLKYSEVTVSNLEKSRSYGAAGNKLFFISYQ